MKVFQTIAIAIMAFMACVSAAPAKNYDSSNELRLTKRDVQVINHAISGLQEYSKMKSVKSFDVTKRDNIVTDVLTAIADTDLAPSIIEYFIDDPTLANISTTVIVDVVKSGLINIDALFTALNNSGLAVQVIQDLINDCQFYAEIYNLALQFVGNLVGQITNILGGKSKRDLYIPITVIKREKRDLTSSETSLLTSLMTSLKDSGLADQVVEALVTDQNFYTWGANLIEQLFSSGAITLPEIVEAIAQSGLIPSLFQNFFNVATLKTVIVNALAAALGKCGTPSVTGTATATGTGGTSTQSAGVSCKRKRKRSY
ncbi:uncharacterized protein RJT21DRAFT_132797 [Scheffersomyces amazonensis]|uniref:uncharacterized protein n=1 Tax=Scheffersomyces amazonensis TaxID=1078765 RepID=UPI00315D5539